MCFGSNDKPKNVTTTTNTAPWGPTQAGLKQGITDLGTLYNSGQFYRANSPYPGQTVAGLAPETTQAWGNITDLAGDGSGIQSAIDYNKSILSGDLSQGFLGGLTSDITDQINAQISASGRYGSGAHQNSIAKGITSAITPYTMQAAQLAPQLDQARYYGAQQLANVGSARQAYAQDLINADINRYNQTQSAPISAITDYMQALSGNWGGSTSATQPVQSSQTNPWLAAGGLGLGFLGSLFGGF